MDQMLAVLARSAPAARVADGAHSRHQPAVVEPQPLQDPGEYGGRPEPSQRMLTVAGGPGIARRLRIEFPTNPIMWVSHDTIYQALFVQARGELRRELARCLRTERAARRCRGDAQETRGRMPNIVMISDRPAEATDRAVPGHWESQWCCQAA